MESNSGWFIKNVTKKILSNFLERPLSRLFCPPPDPWDLLRKNEKMEEELTKKEAELGSKTNDLRRKDWELRKLVEELRRTNEALVVKSDQLGRKNEELGKMKQDLHYYEEENISIKMVSFFFNIL